MKVQHIGIDAFDYPLPDERIARYPLAHRSDSKLLVYRGGEILDHGFADLPSLLPAGSHLLLNETRVLPVRLFLAKPTGGRVEVFLLEPAESGAMEEVLQSTQSTTWKCMVGGLKKWKQGHVALQVECDGDSFELRASVAGRVEDAVLIQFDWDGGHTWANVIEAAGRMPLPPYLGRDADANDAERYQTVFSRVRGSVAAPTASLHFDQKTFDTLSEKGHTWSEVLLHVGAGTFKPVSSGTIGEHHMHREYVEWSLEQLQNLAIGLGRGLIPVGTTALRSVESLYWLGLQAALNTKNADWFGPELPVVDQWEPYQHGNTTLPDAARVLEAVIDGVQSDGRGRLRFYTGLMIAPGYTFRMASGLITNFHQPKSTLLLLVSALIGEDWKSVYQHALDSEYRFLSYGDASLLLP